MQSDHPQPVDEVDHAFGIIECSIPAELTLAEWRQRRSAARPHHFYRLRSYLRALGG